VRRAAQSFKRAYGASPLHLLGALACFAVIAAAVSGWLEEPWVSLRYILIWFVGAILAHDLLLLPVYTVLDRIMAIRLHRRAGLGGAPGGHVHGWVYLRVPILLSGLILLVFGAEILNLGDSTFHVASGEHQHVYLARYLVTVAVLFTVSGLAYALTRIRARAG
jgi:hypothetical protein